MSSTTQLLIGAAGSIGLMGIASAGRAAQTPPVSVPQKPNILIILADDLGYGDLGCYGQKRFVTPCIDSLAESGILFLQHYAGSTVSAPSRCALLTGRHTGHSAIRGNREWEEEGQWPLPEAETTLAEKLHEAGYITGAFGKWGLGYPGSSGDPLNQGFNTFFGYNCQRLAHHYYPYHLWDNRNKYMLAANAGFGAGEYAPETIHKRALEFIGEHASRPFFMYYASIIPHAELMVPDSIHDRFIGRYLPEKQYIGTDSGPMYRKGPYGSQPESHAAFAAMVSMLDRQVGELVRELKTQGVLDNTIIIFTSDNGPHLEGGADPDFFDSNGPFRGYKRDLYEGGIRVPMLVSWPGVVAPGRTSNHICAMWDVMPTICSLVGITPPPGIDGISFLPELTGASQPGHPFLYWEFHEQGGRIAVRRDNWKLIVQNLGNTPHAELYNLQNDPGESENLSNRYPHLAEELQKLAEESRVPAGDFPFVLDKKAFQ